VERERELQYYYTSLVELSGYYCSNDVMYTIAASLYPIKKEKERIEKKKIGHVIFT
jgi:hypothetical protein